MVIYSGSYDLSLSASLEIKGAVFDLPELCSTLQAQVVGNSNATEQSYARPCLRLGFSEIQAELEIKANLPNFPAKFDKLGKFA